MQFSTDDGGNEENNALDDDDDDDDSNKSNYQGFSIEGYNNLSIFLILFMTLGILINSVFKKVKSSNKTSL